MKALTIRDFKELFHEIHGQPPFPWQMRLMETVAESGAWPDVLDLPTGAGKTAAIDIAVFHLALDANLGSARRAPIRMAFVVDRRLVVDDAYTRARKISNYLSQAKEGTVGALVAERLKFLSGDGPSLVARRLRGGVPREEDWTHTPSQPTILCSTVDQVGSRLLFRGYGVSDRMKPVHAGLLGADCLIFLDEAHLAEPFRQTLNQIALYRSKKWRETEYAAPWGVVQLSATAADMGSSAFCLDGADYDFPALRSRLIASKPARLILTGKSNSKAPSETAEDGEGEPDQLLSDSRRIDALVGALESALQNFGGVANSREAFGIVVNRVGRARKVFDRIRTLNPELRPLLLIGPSRPVARDALALELEPIRTNNPRTSARPIIIVATQCIEAGVDIDLDALITEAAPLDSLRQRFGRLNRAGRQVQAFATIVADKNDLGARVEDPVYGQAIRATWEYLSRLATADHGMVDFGLLALNRRLEADPPPTSTLAPKEDAPILLPAHLDLLSQTSPIPNADPDVSLFLHGPQRQADSVAVIWRADLEVPDLQEPEDVRKGERATRQLLVLMPPRSAEAIELPLWAVRNWLGGGKGILDQLGDLPTQAPDEEQPIRTSSKAVFRWRGDEDDSQWILPSRIRSGDVIVVPLEYGGIDEFGWNPGCSSYTPEEMEGRYFLDVSTNAAEPYASRRFVVRVGPGLVGGKAKSKALANALSQVHDEPWLNIRAKLVSMAIPEEIKAGLHALDHSKNAKKAGKGTRSLQVYWDAYGMEDGKPKGIVFVAPFGIRNPQEGPSDTEDGIERPTGIPNSTEDDKAGSLPGFSQSLQEHSDQVQSVAASFSGRVGLPAEFTEDLKKAGFLHDAGKADPRFQSWLAYGDPFGIDPENPGEILAKSGRWLPPKARAQSGLPEFWRHEALSVRMATLHPRLAEARDPELVIWLIGSHHGYGRPFFPHADPADAAARKLPKVLGFAGTLPPGYGPQSLAFDWNGMDWAGLYNRLKKRYGAWELARFEAILRLADHRASEEAAAQAIAEEDV